MEEYVNEEYDELWWETLEYPYWKKSAEWYLSALILSGAIVASAFLLENIIFGILVIVATFTLLLLASLPPKNVVVKLTTKGVQFGKYHYPYSTLDTFGISEKDDPPRLLLKSKKILSPLTVIQIEDLDPEEVRYFLEHYLEEEDLFESPFQKIMERIGF